MSVGVVVPTIRPESYSRFLKSWEHLFIKHDVELVKVQDGEKPKVTHREKDYSIEDIMGRYSDIIFDKNDGIRNLGFAYINKYLPDVTYILTLDDDVSPVGDTIQDHIDALNMRVPISWMSTASEYMRGFPYAVRDEAEVVLSHGIWDGVKDYDAPSQLVNGNKDATFYVGPIPRGVLFPMCIMNVAFKRKIIKYMYQAPMGHRVGMDRFADIWSGIEVKKEIDKIGFAAVSGYSTVYHERASNVFTNLSKEVRGLILNETFWRGDENDVYFKTYRSAQRKWIEYIESTN